MANAETSFVYDKNPKKYLGKIKELAGNEKDEFEQERMFGRVAKIPISNTFRELAEMDFVNYGDYATFLHIQDTFSRFPVIIFQRTKKMKSKRRKW